MDRTSVTVSLRTLLITLLAAVALLAAYLLGGADDPPASAAGGDPTGEARQITMTGKGEASAVPDRLSFALAVAVTRPDLDEAFATASASMSRVLAELGDHGVDKGDVQTTGLSMDPVYDYHSSGPPTLRGYRVAQRARVVVDELRDGGPAVSAAVEAGGNDVRVSDLRLLVGDTDEVMAQAREAAVAEARAKAEQYAAASGRTLGEVVTVHEVRSRPLPTPMGQVLHRAAYDADLAAMPIRAGRDEAAVTVRIVWELA